MKRYLPLTFVLLFSMLGCSTICNWGAGEHKKLDVGIKDLSGQIINSIVVRKRQRLVVLPFLSGNREESEFGRYLADEVSDKFFLAQKFEVVDWKYVDRIMKDLEMTKPDLVNADVLKKLCAQLKADTIALGAYTVLDKSIKIRVRLIDSDYASVVDVAKTEIVMDRDVRKMLGLKARVVGRWTDVPESEKKEAFDTHMRVAMENFKKASATDYTTTQKALYKQALAEIEMALSIYPNDASATRMKDEIKKIIDSDSSTINY